ncbi:endonuclease/exonuclease/phosphatase family protein [Mesobaculum littorinae]|uniref:Endonuclease/exonuclease/phosphatase family protein n=1 Tax=Mesobaculum littorinae TaxID=2486419 RepID=A0A438ALP3_9RHOB|nr:endonuclease/exonuclease/phosphatase family protein [Mesobaculum littorinae]RVV99592.1 endonuclease/exonuclease/phosphatase family protein [Mesobaculum littorinae]
MIRTILAWVLGAVLLALCAASLLPLLESDRWWIRYLDFPRMQISVALIVVFALYALVKHRRGRLLILPGLLVLASLGYHGWRLWPFQPLAQVMDPGGAQCASENRLRVLIANVQRGNRDAQKVIDLARSEEPDLFLVMETNGWWDEALQPLDAAFPHVVQDIPEDATFYGLHLFSRHPLENTDMRHPYGSDAPMVTTRVEHPAGPLRFIGVHPRPPHQSGQPSTIRDATVLEAALTAAEGDLPSVIAGDYNATPWERTARRALRLGGLIDPRAGRGPYPTYRATSRWMLWPLDQILWQPGLALADFAVLDPVGSDHFPFRVDLCVGQDAAQEIIPPRNDDAAEAQATFEKARALGAQDGPEG